MQPAVRIDGLGRRRRVVPVAAHHRVPADEHLPRPPLVGEHPDLDALGGAAGGERDDLVGIAWPAGGGEPAALRQPVGGDDLPEPELPTHPGDQGGRDDRRTGDRQPQRAEVGTRARGVLEQRAVERRRPRDHVDAFARDDPQRDVDVEDLERHAGGALDQAGQQACLVAEGVEERCDDEHPLALPEPHRVGPGAEEPDALAVGGDGALGLPGGAGGEDDVARVLGRDGAGRLLDVLLGHLLGPGEEAPQVGGTDHLHVRVSQCRQRVCPQETGEEDVVDDQGRHPRPVEEVARLLALEAGVDRHEHHPETGQAESGHDPVRAVRGPHGDPVAVLEPGGGRSAREDADPGEQVGERQTHRVGDDCLPVGGGGSGGPEHRGHRVHAVPSSKRLVGTVRSPLAGRQREDRHGEPAGPS